MIIVDTNIIIYALDRDSEYHDEARIWLERQLSARIKLALPWLVLIGFLRIVTNRRIITKPLSVDEAINAVQSLVDHPSVSTLDPGPDHWRTLSRLLLRSGTAGNLTNDAHLAAIAIDHNCLVCSADNDFRRFEGVQFYNPLQDDGVHEPRLAYST